jgi:hypothetical protein
MRRCSRSVEPKRCSLLDARLSRHSRRRDALQEQLAIPLSEWHVSGKKTKVIISPPTEAGAGLQNQRLMKVRGMIKSRRPVAVAKMMQPEKLVKETPTNNMGTGNIKTFDPVMAPMQKAQAAET